MRASRDWSLNVPDENLVGSIKARKTHVGERDKCFRQREGPAEWHLVSRVNNGGHVIWSTSVFLLVPFQKLLTNMHLVYNPLRTILRPIIKIEVARAVFTA